MSSYLDANRANWDERADIHVEDVSGTYPIERFLAGEEILFPIEAAEIGEVSGLRVLHLQCHIGLDTLCLARRGASVTGIDFSPNAIRYAERFADKAGLAARFLVGDVYHAAEVAGAGYDLVYATWGTINWLPDIARWAAVVAAVLKPGGRLYFADAHPSLAVLEEADGRLEPTFNFRTPSSVPLEFTAAQTYTGDPRRLANPQNFEWLHPVSDILMALIANGMVMERMAEHEALPWQMFPMMVRGEDRMWRLPTGFPRLPLSLSLTAVRKA